MWIDEAGKAKILSETDPDTIFSNFKHYTGNEIDLAENLTPEEVETGLFIIKRITVGHIEYKQGETIPLDLAIAQIKQEFKFKEKYLNDNTQNNNKQRCQKRHL